jgi:hypothetical protein
MGNRDADALETLRVLVSAAICGPPRDQNVKRKRTWLLTRLRNLRSSPPLVWCTFPQSMHGDGLHDAPTF